MVERGGTRFKTSRIELDEWAIILRSIGAGKSKCLIKNRKLNLKTKLYPIIY